MDFSEIFRDFPLAGMKGADYKGATARALRLSVRTTDFHSVKRGSTPLGRATVSFRIIKQFQNLGYFGSTVKTIGIAQVALDIGHLSS